MVDAAVTIFWMFIGTTTFAAVIGAVAAIVIALRHGASGRRGPSPGHGAHVPMEGFGEFGGDFGGGDGGGGGGGGGGGD